MHWDTTVARIILIVSVTNIALAAPAVVRLAHIGVAEVPPEKRLTDDEATDGAEGSASEPMPVLVSDSSPSESSHGDWPPASPAASYHEGLVPLGTNRYFITPVQFYRVHDELESNQVSAPESPDGSSHLDPALASPAGSLLQVSADSAPDPPPSGLLHHDASAIPSSQPSGSLHQDAASAPDLEPSGPSNQDAMPDSQPPASLHQDATPDLQPSDLLHQDAVSYSQPSASLHQDVTPDLQPSGSLHQDATPDLQPSGLLHQDVTPDVEPSGSLHQDATPDLQPSSLLHQDVTPDFESSGSLHQDAAPDLQPSGLLHQDAIPDSQPSGPLNQDSVPGSPLHDTFFNDALKKKLTIYAGLGTVVVGVPVGLTIGAHKLIKDTHSHGAETAGRDLASSDFVIRGLGKSVHNFQTHPLPRKDRVSRGVVNLRDDDLRFSNVLTRRALASLD